jgi:adenylate cyclase
MTLELDPTFAPSYRLLSLSYQGMDLFDEAIAENQRWGNLTGNKIKTDVALAQIYAAAGRKEDAEKIIEEVESGEVLGGNDYRGMAMVYAFLGQNDMAFKWLEKSFEKHEESLCSLKIDPKMDSLRSDPRFNLLLKKIGFED